MMTLSRVDFNRQCIEFVQRCQNYSDTWRVSRRFGEGNRLVEINASKLVDEINESSDELMLTKTEQRNEKLGGEGEIRSYEYSVIFSESYEVPIMYFCVSNQGGCSIPVERVVSPEAAGDLSKVVSQVEHPLLFRPVYMIHPCRTEDFMQTHHKYDKSGYLISWLSIIGTLIDLKLDIRFSLITNEDCCEQEAE